MLVLEPYSGSGSVIRRNPQPGDRLNEEAGYFLSRDGPFLRRVPAVKNDVFRAKSGALSDSADTDLLGFGLPQASLEIEDDYGGRNRRGRKLRHGDVEEPTRRSALGGRHLRRLSFTTALAGIWVKARRRSRRTLANSVECCNASSIAEWAIAWASAAPWAIRCA